MKPTTVKTVLLVAFVLASLAVPCLAQDDSVWVMRYPGRFGATPIHLVLAPGGAVTVGGSHLTDTSFLDYCVLRVSSDGPPM